MFAKLMVFPTDAWWTDTGYIFLNSEKQRAKARLRHQLWSWRTHKPRVVSHPEGSTYPGTEWTVLRELPRHLAEGSKQVVRIFECRCNRCGLVKTIHLNNLMQGRSKMCRRCGAKQARANRKGKPIKLRPKKPKPTLTKPQLAELRRVAARPQPTSGKIRVRLQNTLRQRGLVHVSAHCEITDAGRAELAKEGNWDRKIAAE